MRIDRLHIAKFKNLTNLEINFDETSFNSVIIGVNGSGKSNLLEAITIIFRNLSLKEDIPFDFSIDYKIRNEKIRIIQSQSLLNFYHFEKMAYQRVSRKIFYSFSPLPNNVFGYYSGTSRRFEELFRKHSENYREQLVRDDDVDLRPLFWASPKHAQFVLLAFALDEEPKAKNFLAEYLSITDIATIEFVFKEPDWTHKKTPNDLWGAKGAVSRLFSNLKKISGDPSVETVKKTIGIKKTKSYQIQRFHPLDAQSFRLLMADQAPKDVFRLLESSLLSDLLEYVDVRVKFNSMKEPISFFDLSEGQKQLLTVLGLLRFTSSDESLFLLDEPDTQLNPNWAKKYLDILREYAGNTENCHLIMTTHSPIVFSGLLKNEVIILNKDVTGRITASNPDRDPKGLGFSSILTSEFFAMESSFDAETLGFIKERRSLLAKSQLSEVDIQNLESLNHKLFEADYVSGDRDELYKLFLRRLHEKKPALFSPDYTTPPTLDKEMLDILDEVIKESINEIS